MCQVHSWQHTGIFSGKPLPGMIGSIVSLYLFSCVALKSSSVRDLAHFFFFVVLPFFHLLTLKVRRVSSCFYTFYSLFVGHLVYFYF